MNKKLLPALIAMGLSAAASAEVDVYGKLQMTLQNEDVNDESVIKLNNHSSRLGFKGSEETESGLTAIYQYELGINPDEKKDAKTGETKDAWTRRNSFLGFKGNFGTVKAGYFDTAMKSSQGKVDVFGDFDGDIHKIITVNDIRKGNTLAYTTPDMGGFSLTGSYIMPEVEDGDAAISASASYTGGGLYAALAYDSDVVVVDSTSVRGVVTYTIGELQLGALYEQFELDMPGVDSEAGWIVSGKWGVAPKWDLKLEYGQSDIVYQGGELVSVGMDYEATKNLSFLGYVTQKSADDDAIDATHVALGTILKF